jgi:CO dehydrogenase/acetyl-CoA synthase gamma subunit (corrinoid Fe-S protein)
MFKSQSFLPKEFKNVLKHDDEAEYNKFRVVHTTSNGNCLFESIVIALKSIGLNYSIEHLRNVVAHPILNPNDKGVTDTLKTWIELARDALNTRDRQLLIEYNHVLPVFQIQNPNDTQIRQVVYSQMLKNSFWGEEYALRILETRLQVNFLVILVDHTKVIPHCLLHAEKKYMYYIILLLTKHYGEHYQPVSYCGQFIFHYGQLPVVIKTLFQFK